MVRVHSKGSATEDWDSYARALETYLLAAREVGGIVTTQDVGNALASSGAGQLPERSLRKIRDAFLRLNPLPR